MYKTPGEGRDGPSSFFPEDVPNIDRHTELAGPQSAVRGLRRTGHSLAAEYVPVGSSRSRVVSHVGHIGPKAVIDVEKDTGNTADDNEAAGLPEAHGHSSEKEPEAPALSGGGGDDGGEPPDQPPERPELRLIQGGGEHTDPIQPREHVLRRHLNGQPVSEDMDYYKRVALRLLSEHPEKYDDGDIGHLALNLRFRAMYHQGTPEQNRRAAEMYSQQLAELHNERSGPDNAESDDTPQQHTVIEVDFQQNGPDDIETDDSPPPNNVINVDFGNHWYEKDDW